MKLFFSLANAVHILWHIVLIVIFKESFYDHMKDHGSSIIWTILIIFGIVWLAWHHYKDVKRFKQKVKERPDKDGI